MLSSDTTARLTFTMLLPKVIIKTSRTVMATGQQKAMADNTLREEWHDTKNGSSSVEQQSRDLSANNTPNKHPRRKKTWWSWRQLFR